MFLYNFAKLYENGCFKEEESIISLKYINDKIYRIRTGEKI